jgi:acyl-[acyl carrier protein]--UDP-N-acetylglucosamine O-acyltransferase
MIHSTAIVDASAAIAEEVEIGPYCVIGRMLSLAPDRS